MGTIDTKEIEHFQALANEWWDVKGKFKILHIINPLRISFILNECEKYFKNNSVQPLTGLKLLDIGCGGGLLSEPMRRLGALVTGIDASSQNIETAQNHSKLSELDINYLHTSSEELARTNQQFDVILAIEVIEHVSDYKLFLRSIKTMLKPGGLLFISTINRNLKSLLLAKIAAEYVLHWVPMGTHSWGKFLTPAEIQQQFKKLSIKNVSIMGMNYNLLTNKWHFSDDTSINYILCGRTC